MKLSTKDKAYEIVEIREQFCRIYRCHCKCQRCNPQGDKQGGKYIRTRIGQTRCMWSYSMDEWRQLPLKPMIRQAKKFFPNEQTKKVASEIYWGQRNTGIHAIYYAEKYNLTLKQINELKVKYKKYLDYISSEGAGSANKKTTIE